MQKNLQNAIDSGADVIKFQIYTGDGIVNKISPENTNTLVNFNLLKNNILS